MTEFTEEKLAELRAVAERATQDEWEAYTVPGDRKTAPYCAVAVGETEVVIAKFEGGYFDAAHIATFDPPTALALIAALEAKTAEVEDARKEARMRRSESADFERERDEARAEVQRLEESLVELAPSAAIMPTTEVVVDGDFFTWGDLPGVLSRARESLAEARRESKGQYVKRQNAEAALERVRALHQPVDIEPSETICDACSTLRGTGENMRYFPYEEYPCPTIQAIEGAEQ